MAINPRKRQQQLAKKKAKRKAAVQSKKRVGAQFGNLANDIAAARMAPIHECLVPEELFEHGMGTVVFSRDMGDGEIAACFFLVDTLCLGVKSAFFRILSEDLYHNFINEMMERGEETFLEVGPACVRKLVEGAEAYAHDLGFAPDPDYKVARMIFAEVDSAECGEEFAFGEDGKPCYVQGPEDTQAKVRKIVDTLRARCGEGNCEVVLMLDGGALITDEKW